ncbi:MAG: TonB-dependent receptor [Pseudomonadota bacterium]
MDRFRHIGLNALSGLSRRRSGFSAVPGVLLAVALATGLAPARATEDAVLEVIQVTAKRRAVSTTDTAQPVTVVDRQALAAAAPLISVDALRGSPGVFVQQTTPGQGIAIVRGLKGSEVLHLVDGMRLNNTLFRNAPNQYLALVDAQLLERIEVVRGPVSTLYGADAMGGVVQFLTQGPEFERELHGSTRVLLGTADEHVTLSAALGGGSAVSAWRGQVTWQDVGDRRTARGTVAPSGYEARAASLSWRYRLSSATELRLDLQHLEQPSTPRVDELVPGFGQTQPASAEFFFEPNRRSFAHVAIKGERENPWFDAFQWHLAVQEIEDDRRSRDFDSPVRQLESNASQLFGLTGQFQKTLSPALDLIYGLEWYDDTVDSVRLEEPLDGAARQPVRPRFPDGASQGNQALYAHLDAAISERLNLEAGLRYSRWDLDLAAMTPADVRLDQSQVTGSLAARWAVNDSVNLVANLGQGYRAPNIFDLGTLGARPGNRFNVANPRLQPEEVLSLDVGVKWSRPGWRGELVAFTLDYDDKITSVLTGNPRADGRVEVRSENISAVRLRGLELGLVALLSDSLTGTFNLNSVRGTEKVAGGEQPADRVPPLNGEASLQWAMSERWRFKVLTRFARRQDNLSPRDARDPRINPAGTPGWVTWDLQARWAPNDIWDIDLTAHNLADRAYREHGSGIDAPGRGVIFSLRRAF